MSTRAPSGWPGHSRRATLVRIVLVPLLVALLVLVGTIASSGAGQAAGTGDPAATYASTAHKATNKARTGNGLGRLKRSRCLATYAARQAAVMAAAGTLSHQDLGAVLVGCHLRSAGENVALGFRSGHAVVGGWMRSEGHRHNILTAGFRKEAVAAVRGPDGVWYVAQVFGG